MKGRDGVFEYHAKFCPPIIKKKILGRRAHSLISIPTEIIEKYILELVISAEHRIMSPLFTEQTRTVRRQVISYLGRFGDVEVCTK